MGNARMTAAIIVDPRSGDRAGQRRWRSLTPQLLALAPGIPIHDISRAGDALGIVDNCIDAGCDHLIAVGADATFGAVVDAVLSSTRPEMALSFLALDRNSDLARTRANRASGAAISALLTAPERWIDAGRLTCIGEDGAPLSRHVVTGIRLGAIGQPLTGLLRRHGADRVRVVVDGLSVYQGPVALVAASLGASIAGGVATTQDDGRFEILIARGAPAWKRWSLSNALRRGDVSDPMLSRYRGRVVEIYPLGSAAPAAALAADGQSVGRLPARLEILPGALRQKC